MLSLPKTRERKSIERDKINVPLKIRKIESDKKKGIKSSKSNNTDGKKKTAKKINQLYNIGKIENNLNNKKMAKCNPNQDCTKFNFTVIKETFTNVHVEKIRAFKNYIRPETPQKNIKPKRLSDSGIVQIEKNVKLPSKLKNYVKSTPNLKPVKLPTVQVHVNHKSIQKLKQKIKNNLNANIKNQNCLLASDVPKVPTARNNSKVPKKRKRLSEVQREQKLSKDRIKPPYKIISSENSKNDMFQVSTEQTIMPEVSTERSTSSKAQASEETSACEVPIQQKSKSILKEEPITKEEPNKESVPNIINIKQLTNHISVNNNLCPKTEEILGSVTTLQIKEDNIEHAEVFYEARMDKILDTADIDKYAVDVCKQTATTILDKLNRILERLEIILTNKSSQKCILT